MSKYYNATWGKAVVRELGINFTPQVDLFLRAWAQSESGPPLSQGGAVWNPFNTTLALPGSTNFNSVGVKNYVTWQDGAHATAKTLSSKKYVKLTKALGDGTSAMDMAVALAATPWGTGSIVQKVLASGGPREFGIGNCYPTPRAPYSHGAAKIVPGSRGADVDEVLRALGNKDKWYVGSVVNRVKAYQLLRPALWPADGKIGAKTFKSLTGHA